MLVFSIIHLVPGDPAQVIAGADAPPETVHEIDVALGLDQPLPVQYLRYMDRLLHGDLGRSILTKQPVTSALAEAYPKTIELTFAAAVLTPIVAIPLGLIAALRRQSWVDQVILALSALGITAPVFAVGLFLQLVFGYRLGWLPIADYGGAPWTWDGLRHLILPALTLSIGSIAVTARVGRASMLDILRQDYIRTANAKGLSQRVVVVRHGLRNALLPVITLLGLQIAYLLSGAVVTETVFSWPGVGRLLIFSIQSRDFPVVQGAVLVVALTFVLVNLVVDVLYTVIDPRIRFG
ncbi:MAG: ABC transporter permease [Chloroflexi bacterium]|nr:ABC transporter permease [Chloroflexota bacterium]